MASTLMPSVLGSLVGLFKSLWVRARHIRSEAHRAGTIAHYAKLTISYYRNTE